MSLRFDSQIRAAAYRIESFRKRIAKISQEYESDYRKKQIRDLLSKIRYEEKTILSIRLKKIQADLKVSNSHDDERLYRAELENVKAKVKDYLLLYSGVTLPETQIPFETTNKILELISEAQQLEKLIRRKALKTEEELYQENRTKIKPLPISIVSATYLADNIKAFHEAMAMRDTKASIEQVESTTKEQPENLDVLDSEISLDMLR